MEWKWEDVIEELKMNAEQSTGISAIEAKTAIKDIGEVREFRKLGTLEELRALKEKSIPKRPVFDGLYQCPTCKKSMLQGSMEPKGNCCKNCGQALDWSTLKHN